MASPLPSRARPGEAALPAPMGRNGSLDHARLVAALGIVLFHAGAPGAWAGHAGLPFFLMVLLVLAVPSAMRSGWAAYVRGRARRLLVPWALWSAIYLALKLLEVGVAGHPLASELAPWMLLTGPALHLWFLPFAFAATLAVPPLLAAIRPGEAGARPRRAAAILVVTGAALLALAPPGEALDVPFAQWSLAMPPLLLGLAVAIAGAGRRGPGAWALLAVVPVPCAAWALGWTPGLGQLALALGLLAACLAVRLPRSPLSRRAAEAALVVYLAHPAVMSVLERAGLAAPGSLGGAVLTMALSLLLALAWAEAGRRLARPGNSPSPA